MSRRSELLDDTLAMLRDIGIKPVVVPCRGSSHCKVRWVRPNGVTRTLVLSRQTSPEPRARRNNRAIVQRFLREDGFL